MFSLCLLVFGILSFCSPNITFANENSVCFARITGEQVFLQKDLQTTSVLFELPTSYFVKILSEAEDFFYVEYDGVFGYVGKADLTKVYETPKLPFPENVCFNIFSAGSASLKTTPSADGQTLAYVSETKTLKYFGKTQGYEAISGLGDVWFFAELNQDGQKIQGYVYAPLTTNLSEIPLNTEIVSTTPPNNDSSILSDNFKNPNNLWLVAVLFLIAFLLFALTFLPFHLKSKKTKSKTGIIPKI